MVEIHINEDTYSIIKEIRMLMKPQISPLSDDTIVNVALERELEELKKVFK